MTQTIDNIEGEGENLITQKGSATESQTVSHVKGKKNVITQESSTSPKANGWTKWGSIAAWISIIIAIILGLITHCK